MPGLLLRCRTREGDRHLFENGRGQWRNARDSIRTRLRPTSAAEKVPVPDGGSLVVVEFVEQSVRQGGNVDLRVAGAVGVEHHVAKVG